MVQVVVVHAVLVVLEGHHAEGKGAHAARLLLVSRTSRRRVAHLAGRRLAVTGLSRHQHVCRDTGRQSIRALAHSLPPRSRLLHPP